MRNKLAFLLILFANILMFAHAVIPHHHADGMVVDLFDISGDPVTPHSTPCNHSNHDSSHHEGAGESCFIREIVVKERNIEQELKVSVRIIKPETEGLFIASAQLKPAYPQSSFDSKPFDYYENEGLPDYSSPELDSFSFRGPPIV